MTSEKTNKISFPGGIGMQNWPRLSIWIVSALWSACTLLPWWSRQDRHISGFAGATMGNPGWWVLLLAGLIVFGQLLGQRWSLHMMRLAAFAGLLLSLGHLWRGWRLSAIGIGLPLLVALSLLNLVLVLRHLRNQPH
jgi:hypothetical protein